MLDYFPILIKFYVLAIFAFAVIRYEIAIVMYIAYMILVPGLFVTLPFGTLSYNMVNFALLAAFIYNFKIRKKLNLDFRTIIPFLFLFAFLMFFSVFVMVVPSVQFRQWRADLMTTCILPFIIWNVSKNDEKFTQYAKWGLMLAVSIAGIYAMYCWRLDGENPYIAFIFNNFGFDTTAVDVFATGARIRNQGTMSHPFNWVYHLSIFSVLFMIYLLKERKLQYLGLLCLVVFNIYIADIRTGLVTSIVALAYLYVRYNKVNMKTVFLGAGIVVVLYFIVITNEDLYERLLSIIDLSGTKTDVKGSSFQMRINQFNGCLNEIYFSRLFGNGYAWTTYYMVNFGDHPVILAFESLIYVILCNSGFMGIVIWSIFAFMLCRVPRKIFEEKKNVYCVNGFIIMFFTYTLATGLYTYLISFAIYYSLLMGYLYQQEQKNKILKNQPV